MAVVALPLLVWAVASSPSRLPVPIEALALSVLGLLPLVQWGAGRIDFAGDAWLAAVYVFAVAAAVMVGARAQQLQPNVLPNALFVSFGIASVASVVLMLAQWLQWNGLGTLLLALPDGSRLSANVGQPNQLATLLVWGLLSLGWAYERRSVHGAVLWLLAAFLLAGVAITQSRTGVLELLVVVCVALSFRRRLRVCSHPVALLVLAAWLVVVAVAWPTVSGLASDRIGALSLQERMEPGTRMMHWRLLADAVALRPWFGWGWNQVVLAQVQLAPSHPATHEVLQYSHNIFLDLVLWNGLPIGILAGLAIVVWFVRQFRLVSGGDRVPMLLVVAVFMVHAALELPHGYLLFLVPVGLMVGALHVPMRARRDPTVSRAVVVVPFVLLIVAVVVIIDEYRRIEDAWIAQRFRTARIGAAVEVTVPQVRVLSNLQAMLEFGSTEPQPAMSAEQLALLHKVSRRYPSAGGLFRLASALALNGDADGATRCLALLCHIHSPAQCDAAKQAWMAKSAAGNPALASLWPSASPDQP